VVIQTCLFLKIKCSISYYENLETHYFMRPPFTNNDHDNDEENESLHRQYGKKLEKALGERRYLRQGKAIRQVTSPSSLCQRFPYAPFNATVTKISKWSRIHDSCRITSQNSTAGSLCHARHFLKISERSVHNFWVILLTHRQTDKQRNKNRQKHKLLGRGNYYRDIE